MDNWIWFLLGWMSAATAALLIEMAKRAGKRKASVSQSRLTPEEQYLWAVEVLSNPRHWPPRPELYDSPAPLTNSPSSTPPESPKNGGQTSMPSSSARPGGILWPSEITVTPSVCPSCGTDGRERVKTYSMPLQTSASPCACESCVDASGAAVAGPAPISSESPERSFLRARGALTPVEPETSESPDVCSGPAAWLCTVGHGHEVCRIANAYQSHREVTRESNTHSAR